MDTPPHTPRSPVECYRCATRVLVAKGSPAHTSVQWDSTAAVGCGEFAAQVAAGTYCALIPQCTALRDSIDVAVEEGRVEVGGNS